jgi:hypothetical protein
MNLGSIGQCIYCGSTSGLTKEHIIPYALQGDWVLNKASCISCAKLTGKLEQRILRGPLLSVRAVANFKTRQPEERPSGFPLVVKRGGQEEKLNVPTKDLFTLLTLPLMPKAAYFEERSYVSRIDVIGAETIAFGNGPAKLMNMLRADSISITKTYSFVDFIRMIGKIGYGLVVADFGLSAIADPYILPAVMGQIDEIGKWVGSDDFTSEVEKRGAVHACVTGIVEHRGEKLIVAKVKLFADVHPTGYHVIVGRAK